MRKSVILSFVLLSVFVLACAQQTEQKKEGAKLKDDDEEAWLTGTIDEKFTSVEHQLGGFSRTMAEVGYRYTELYWAGKSQNWGYAAHQLEHIEEAIEDGMVRRPKRAANATIFLTDMLPAAQAAIAQKDSATFDAAFQLITLGCNSCHQKEGKAFINIVQPEVRLSPVR